VRHLSSAKALAALLTETAERLKAFGKTPCLVAEAPNKFNDAHHDDYWYAVQIGQTYWEQSQYFEGSPTVIRERSEYQGEFTGQQLIAQGSLTASSNIASAPTVLDDLRKAGWRGLAEAALEGYDNVLAVVIQHGQVWLCCTYPVEGEGAAWIWTEGAGFVHFGTCNRLDQDIGSPCPLYFDKVNANAVEHLSADARQYFAPVIADAAANERLSSLVEDAARQVRAATDMPVNLCSRESRWGFYDHAARHSWKPAQVFWNAKSFNVVVTKGRWPASSWNPRTKKEDPYPDEAYALSAVLKSLEDADWRSLFGKAFGVPLINTQMLSLFIGSSFAILVRENSTFLLDNGRLQFAGLCNFPNLRDPANPP
jgi:hypothetical protein